VTPRWLLGFLCLLLGASAALGWLEATRKVDRLLHDGWVRLQQRTPPDDIVIVAIDPDSLARLGRWPWSREQQSSLFEALARHGARATAIDILYLEPAVREASDERLAEAIGSLPQSVLPVLVERGGAGRAVEERLPLPVLTRAVGDLGHIVLPVDDDGIVRRVPLKAGFVRPHWPTLALATRSALDPDATVLDPLPGRRFPQTGRSAVWMQDHEVFVPFVGPSGSFAQVSAARVIAGETAREELEGRIVFVGLTSTGLGDMVPTPVSALDQPMAGIEVHANVFAALRDGTLVTRAPLWGGALATLLVLLPILLIYSRAAPHWALPGALVGTLLPVLASYLLYVHARLWFAPLSASVPILASYLLWSRNRLDFVNRFLEREQKKLEPHFPHRDPGDDQALVRFFDNATRHLPLAGWRFTVHGRTFSGGARPPSSGGESTLVDEWTARGDIHAKRYRTPGQLRIYLTIERASQSAELTAYVDSLARVRTRSREPRASGTVERLQRNAERLRERLAWLRSVKVFSETVLAGGPIGFVVWNPAGEWVRGNVLVHEMLPMLEERAALIDLLRVIGHDPGERGIADERRASDRERFDALVLEGVPWQVAHESGERALVVNFSAIGDSLSRRLICASVIDVSEIRSAERARTELVDYLSHDLRSPLVSALMQLEEEDEGRSGAVEEAVTERSASVQDNIRHSLAMMDDLLDVARADSLREERFSEVLLDAVLDHALAELLPQARARDIDFDVDYVDEELWVSGDVGSLQRAVSNLLGNAIKYSPEGAQVRVRLRRAGEEAELEIEDDGIGIDPGVIGELFTRFRRDARVAGRIKGTGLGLAFVARVVRQHAGEVEATSVPGHGTRVMLRLPLERAAETTAHASGREDEEDAGAGSRLDPSAVVNRT